MSTLILVSPFSDEDEIEDTRSILLREGEEDITFSTEEYQKSFPLYGTWEGWISYVAEGTDYLSRLPVFSKFITFDTQIGRANGSIITKALGLGKECLYFNGKEFTSILSLEPVSEDWSSGWEIITL